MSSYDLLSKYKQDVEKIRERAKALELTEDEINEIFTSCFETLRNELGSNDCDLKKSKTERLFCRFIRVLVIILGVLFVGYVILNVHQPTSSIVLRNVQNLIYPGLKLLRYLSVPIIKHFPSLTEIYDESCLVENPYFYVQDMECWPCENVHSVIDLSGLTNQSLYQSGIPYIVKTKQKLVTYQSIQELILRNRDTFIKDANRIKSSNRNLQTIQDLETFALNDSKSSNTHISWRINRMVPARFIRELFPRPYFISEWSGQTIERYVMIDEPNASPYLLPNFECSYILVVQGSGERTIILRPSRECGQFCRTVSVVLKPSYVLWYNWWYWRPISLPAENSGEPSISYMTSYC